MGITDEFPVFSFLTSGGNSGRGKSLRQVRQDGLKTWCGIVNHSLRDQLKQLNVFCSNYPLRWHWLLRQIKDAQRRAALLYEGQLLLEPDVKQQLALFAEKCMPELRRKEQEYLVQRETLREGGAPEAELCACEEQLQELRLEMNELLFLLC